MEGQGKHLGTRDAAGARRGHHKWEQLQLKKANQNTTLQRAGAQSGLSPEFSIIIESEHHFSPDNIYQVRDMNPRQVQNMCCDFLEQPKSKTIQSLGCFLFDSACESHCPHCALLRRAINQV